MMEIPLVVRVILLLASATAVAACGMAGTAATWKMVELVNSRRPKAERFNPHWLWLPKAIQLSRAYRTLEPTVPLLRRRRRSWLGMAFALFWLLVATGLPVAGAALFAAFLGLGMCLVDLI